MKTITKPRPIGVGYPLRALRGLPTGARVDHERRVVYGVAVMQLGALNEPDSRPYFADATTIKQVLALGKSNPKGVKSRWTHPNMSNDGMGKFLGRLRNFRPNEDKSTVLADLHLSPIAFRGEDGGLGQQTLDMADQEPDAFGLSVAPVWDFEEMDRLETKEGTQPMRFKKLMAADVVDEPAATRGGIFGGEPLSLATAPHQLTNALNQLFADATPDVIRDRAGGFIETYLASRFGGQGNQKGPEMSGTATPPVGITQEAFELGLVKFGETLTTGLLGKVDEKIKAALTPPEKKDGELSVSDAIAAESKRCSELFALAKNAGFSDWEKTATGWIEKKLSVIEAKAAIADLAIAGNGLSKDGGEQPDDPKAKYRAEYRKNLAVFATMGVSEEDYIYSAMVDNGQAVLGPKTPEPAKV